MTTGTIKFFNAGKGFGFVTPDGGGADIFLPAATLTVSGIATVRPGQRVTFEQGPDKKGPKVVRLRLFADQIVEPQVQAHDQVTVYCDSALDIVADVLSAARAAGYEVLLVDYIATPLGEDQLRRLSHLLNGSGKGLVRRFDPLFSALQLDDRFIGDQELWTAIAKHPTLIDGPILVFAGKARICKAPEDVRLFLGGGDKAAPKPKTLSPRLVAMINGEPLAPAPKIETITIERLAPQPPNPSPPVQPAPEAVAKSKRKAAAKTRAIKDPKKKIVTKKAIKPKKKKPKKN